MERQFMGKAYQASALIITLMFIVLLGLEALVVGLLLSRSTGTEAVLRGKNQSVRRASEIIVNDLAGTIYADMQTNGLTVAQIWAKYKREGSATTYSALASNRYNTVNPESGANDALPIDTSAWVQEYHGNYLHLVGRAKQSDVDLITHKWVLLKPCSLTSNGSAVLTTIVSSVNYPGYRSTVVDPNTGRVFFGSASDTDTASTTLYSWHSSTGLSTLRTGGGIGNRSIFMANDGRVFFGTYSNSVADYFYTWKDNILSTINPSAMNGAGRDCYTSCGRIGGYFSYTAAALDTRNDRVYIGAHTSSFPLLTWKNNVLTTIFSRGNVMQNFSLAAADEIFFTDASSGSLLLHRWTPSAGLTTAVDLTAAGIANVSVGLSGMSTGRVWFGEPNAEIHSWHPGTGLSTINGVYDSAFGLGWFQEMPTGEIFFSDDYQTYVWLPSAAQTVTSLGQGVAGGESLQNASGALTAVTANTFFVWTPTNGLSTIIPADGGTGSYYGAAFDRTNTWLYFGQNYASMSDLYAWNFSTRVLSTLTPSLMDYQGVRGATVVDVNGRAYFGSASSSAGKVVSYKPGSGMTTIISAARNAPGKYSLRTHPVDGVYFGESGATGNFYYYGAGSSTECTTRPY